MPRASLALVLFLAACGGAQHSDPAPVDPTPADPASGDPPAPTPSPLDESLACEADSDCVVGTPGNCCASYCGTDQRAWSASAWASRMQMCSVVECAALEEPACPPGPVPTAIARCVERRCVLATATTR